MARAFGSYPTGHRFKSYFRYHKSPRRPLLFFGAGGRYMRPVGQAVKTPPFHGGNTSSILVRVTRGSAIAEPLFLQNMKLTVRSGNHIQSDLPYPRSAIVFYGQRRFAALPVTVSAVLAKSLERAKGLSILRRLGIGFYTMRSPMRKPSHKACSDETRVYKRLNRFGKESAKCVLRFPLRARFSQIRSCYGNKRFAGRRAESGIVTARVRIFS